MKFWIIEISDFLPNLDGANRLYRAGMLAEALVKRGHKVLWWTSTFNHQLRKQRFIGSATVDISGDYRLRLLYGPGYGRSMSISRIRHNRVTARAFAYEIENIPEAERPDLIYACLPTLEVSEKAVSYGAHCGIPVVVDIRDQWPGIYLSIFPKVVHPMLRLLLKSEFNRAHRILSGASSITGVSESNLKWGLRIAQKDASPHDRWFPLGFPLDTNKNKAVEKDGIEKIKAEYGIGNDSLVITFVGSFSPTCNFNTVMDVARALSRSGEKRVKFIMVGNGAQDTFLKTVAKELNNVVLAGWCEKPKVDKILAMSSVGLAPYTSRAPQTLPNKPFEYMAAGLPILSSLEGECRELIESESVGLHYSSNNPRDFMEKISWFLSHPGETKEMGRKARRLLEEKFNTEMIYFEMAKYLQSVVQNKGIKA